jgi:hypothetical protein
MLHNPTKKNKAKKARKEENRMSLGLMMKSSSNRYDCLSPDPAKDFGAPLHAPSVCKHHQVHSIPCHIVVSQHTP